MKKLILCGLVGALAILLANPIDAQAMDSGIMGGGGFRGYGMGLERMGQGYENEMHYRQNQKYLDRKGAERIFEDYLSSRHNPNLTLGEIKDEGSFFEADLLTQNNSLADKLIVNKDTGRICSAH